MKHNVGGADKIFRIVLGLVIILVGFYFKSWWGAIGLVLLLTGVIGWCPLYLPCKFSSCKVEAKSEEE